MRSVLAICAFLYFVLCLPGVLLALALVLKGETSAARLFGLGVLLFYPAPVLLWIALYLKRRRVIVSISGGLLCLAVAMFGICFWQSPDINVSESSNIRVLIDMKDAGAVGPARSRLSPANMVPEIDQLKLGTYIFPMIDPFIDDEQAVRIRRLFLDIYRDLRQDADFVSLGSALGYCYEDLFLGWRDGRHAYLYMPDKEGPLPVILFLHGSLGNFKGYMWFWKKFADEHGYAILAPTFGAGNWFLDGGVDAVEQARKYCGENPRMDASRVYLAGLSNGGTGVSRVGLKDPADYAGLIYLSGIIERDIVSRPEFADGWRGHRVLVLHGAADRRIPEVYVQEAISCMKLKGVVVASKFYPGEDHFLLFSKPDEMRKDIAGWLERGEKRSSE